MSTRFYKLLPFICIFLIGCSLAPKELRIAEKLMDSKPDSALIILQNIQPQKLKLESNRALYSLLLFQALDNNYKPLQPDSLLNFSIAYYLKQNDQLNLAKCYFYKARICKYAQHYDEATILYFKALDNSQDRKDYALLGKIYSDLGDICSIQKDFNESLKKYQKAIDCFNINGDTIEAYYRIIAVGRIYHFLKDYKRAHKYYKQTLSQTTDSILHGLVYQEIGINYAWCKKYDSAQYFLLKSLKFPYKGTSYAIRCYNLADMFFDINQYDSAFHYATLALKYPSTFFNQRDCYRILVNVEYLRNNIVQMGKYMTQYQNCSDSVRKIDLQTKSSVLENLHNTDQEAIGTKRSMSFIIFVLVIILLLSTLIVYFLYRRNKLKKLQLESFKEQLNEKQQFVSQGLSKKIDEAKALQANVRKNATLIERLKLDNDLYNSILHIKDWNIFRQEMNHAFNQLVDKLEVNYPTITKKEISWCCLQLLDISNVDKMLLLDATTDSLYKLKQRLAQKMNLKNTKDLDFFLKDMLSINN